MFNRANEFKWTCVCDCAFENVCKWMQVWKRVCVKMRKKIVICDDVLSVMHQPRIATVNKTATNSAILIVFTLTIVYTADFLAILRWLNAPLVNRESNLYFGLTGAFANYRTFISSHVWKYSPYFVHVALTRSWKSFSQPQCISPQWTIVCLNDWNRSSSLPMNRSI